MSSEPIRPLLVLPGEVSLDERRFEACPMRIVSKFLECFDRDGKQVFGVPQHVLEALAQPFLSVMNEEVNSLDQAFGGSVARQRNSILTDMRDYDIVADILEELDPDARSLADQKPRFEDIVRRVAAAHKISEDNVRRIFKKSRRR